MAMKMSIKKISIIGSTLGIIFICAPIFYLVFYRIFYLDGRYKDLTFLKMSIYFVPGVLTGIIGMFLATKLLPSSFTAKTFFMGLLALPIGAFIYGLMAGFLLFVNRESIGVPLKGIDILREAKQEVFLTTFVFGHIFFPLAMLATVLAQWLIIREHSDNKVNQ